MFDTSGCSAPTPCSEYGASRITLHRLGSPAGDDFLDVRAADLNGSGRTFDPRTEDVNVVLRDDGGVVYQGTIPANSPGWTAVPGRFTYGNTAGTIDGLVRINLQGNLAGLFHAEVSVRNVSLAAAADARTATLSVRVGDDCWADTVPCNVSANGQAVTCRGGRQP
jgi:hypothetical protein